MMDESHAGNSMPSAIADFRRLRRRADIGRLLAVLRGESADLLPFEQVRQMLRATAANSRELREIPLDAIVGSVGRYGDFTRGFLPRKDSDEQRWARVMVVANGLAGLPPIEVYQIGDAYFVVDGNHRVSVARQNGALSIQAYVTPFNARVKLDPSIKPAELLLRSEQAGFLDATRLDEQRPGSDLTLTEPGSYQILREHIYVHGYYMELEQNRPVDFEEAAAHWYDTVYLPMAQLIRERGLLRGFAGRTEADLYLWVSEHRTELEGQLGWSISPERAAEDLAERRGSLPARNAQAGEQMLEMVIPDELEPSPPTGTGRREQLIDRQGWLFHDILVPINGEPDGWRGLDQALTIARAEGARLYGLHVLAPQTYSDPVAVAAVQAEFERRCAEAGVAGRCAIEFGTVARRIRDRSRWADLVALQINYPPGPSPLQRLTSSLRTLIRTSLRPVLAVPHNISELNQILLAYDGSPKSDEALSLATYIAARWQRPIAVAMVTEDGRSVEGLRLRARAYLTQHGVSTARFIVEQGPVGATLVAIAAAARADILVMGGYGRGPVSDLVVGSAVEDVLRAQAQPVLICQ